MFRYLLPILALILAGAKLEITHENDKVIIQAIDECPDVPTPNPDPTPDPNPNPDPTDKWIQAYYVGYQRGIYPVEAVDFSRITHLTVGRIVPRPDGNITTNFDINDRDGPAMARALEARAHTAGRKALLMVGGDGAHSGFYGATANNFERFVSELLRIKNWLNYDGLDLDWEPINQEDKPLLLKLARELKRRDPNILLTVPIPWVNNNFAQNLDGEFYTNLASIVDRISIMSYHMTGPWGGWYSWHTSALTGEKANTPTSISSSVKAYLAKDVPPGKLQIGVAFYGLCWQGVTGPNLPASNGRIVASDNVISFANVVRDYYNENLYLYDEAAQMPYLSSSNGIGPRRCNFLSIDDPVSIRDKGEFIKENNLGGAIIWTVNQGYVNGGNPLLEALSDGVK